jgi:hypothetical protein
MIAVDAGFEDGLATQLVYRADYHQQGGQCNIWNSG